MDKSKIAILKYRENIVCVKIMICVRNEYVPIDRRRIIELGQNMDQHNIPPSVYELKANE